MKYATDLALAKSKVSIAETHLVAAQPNMLVLVDEARHNELHSIDASAFSVAPKLGGKSCTHAASMVWRL